MTTQALQSAMRARPFRPFTLRLIDGRALHVPHPDYIAHKPGSSVAGVVTDDDAAIIVDLMQIVSIEVPDTIDRGKGKRGKQTRRET
jgi:hypothetical protein